MRDPASVGQHQLATAAEHHVVVVGDVFLGGQLTRETSPRRIVRSQSYWNAGQRILNLESPISDDGDPARKSVLSVGSTAKGTLKALAASAVGLANNHIHDMGSRGITDTLQHLESLGIGHAGAGTNADQASAPYWITDSLCLLAYCHFGVPTLKQVQPATATTPGMNPLTYEQIELALSALPAHAEAILYLHWGEEHLFLPAPYQIAMARRLLEHPRVALIVGAHAHRAQGYLQHRGKRAYFCLGNFLFPNFVILPPATAASDYTVSESTPVTRRYHPVTKPTVKKWPLVNRLSLLVSYDTRSGATHHVAHVQHDDEPTVRELQPPLEQLFGAWIWLLSALLRFPTPLYRPLYWINATLTRSSWRLRVLLFVARQKGLRWTVSRVRSRLLGKPR